MGLQEEKMSNNTKVCPFCAEDIKAAAVVCKHCGRELTPKKVSEVENSISKTTNENLIEHYLIEKEFNSEPLFNKYNPPDQFVTQYYKLRLERLKKNWPQHRPYPLYPYNYEIFIEWYNKLFHDALHHVGNSAEGAIAWLNNNSPKFGILKPLKNLDGEMAANQLKMFFHEYTREEAKQRLGMAVIRLVESAILHHDDPDQFFANSSHIDFSLKESQGFELPASMREEISEAAQRLIRENEDLIESNTSYVHHEFSQEILDNPPTILDRLRVTEYKFQYYRKINSVIIDELIAMDSTEISGKSKGIILKEGIIRLIKSRIINDEVISDLMDEEFILSNIISDLEIKGYEIK